MPIFKALSNAASGLWDFGKRQYNRADKWTGGRLTKMIKAGAKHAITYGLSQLPVVGPLAGATAAYLMNSKKKDPEDANDYIMNKAKKYSERPKTNDIRQWIMYSQHLDKEKKKQKGDIRSYGKVNNAKSTTKVPAKPPQTDPSKMMQH